MRRESFLKLLFVAPIAAALRPLLEEKDWEPEHGFMITREMIEDDIYGPIMGKHYDTIILDDYLTERYLLMPRSHFKTTSWFIENINA